MSGNEKREPLIQVQNLGKSFGNIEVLKDINLNVSQGEFCVLLGPSGSGDYVKIRLS